jgi:hypothetical protein
MNRKTILILGDILAIAILTVIGFATHGKFDFSYIARMGITFFPMLVSWFLAATWVDLFDERVITPPNCFGVFFLPCFLPRRLLPFCAQLYCTAPLYLFLL